MVTADLAPQVE